jgi:hypothetical protein
MSATAASVNAHVMHSLSAAAAAAVGQKQMDSRALNKMVSSLQGTATFISTAKSQAGTSGQVGWLVIWTHVVQVDQPDYMAGVRCNTICC